MAMLAQTAESAETRHLASQEHLSAYYVIGTLRTAQGLPLDLFC